MPKYFIIPFIYIPNCLPKHVYGICCLAESQGFIYTDVVANMFHKIDSEYEVVANMFHKTYWLNAMVSFTRFYALAAFALLAECQVYFQHTFLQMLFISCSQLAFMFLSRPFWLKYFKLVTQGNVKLVLYNGLATVV